MPQSNERPPASLRAYGAALRRHWVSFVTSGTLAAVAILTTNVFGLHISPWLFAAVFIWIGAMVAGFQAWNDTHHEGQQVATDLRATRDERDRQIVALRAELDTARRELQAKPSGPKLALRFDSGDPLCVSTEGGDETFRVQVVNDGDTRATDVRVVLDSVEPVLPALLNGRFHVMKTEVESFDVSPSRGRPPVYVDVLFQRQHAAQGFIQVLRLKGAQWLEPVPTLRLVLRLEADAPTEPLEMRFVADARRSLRPN
jgi:hypothetical protein